MRRVRNHVRDLDFDVNGNEVIGGWLETIALSYKMTGKKTEPAVGRVIVHITKIMFQAA